MLFFLSSIAFAAPHHVVFMIDLSASMKKIYQDQEKMTEVRNSAKDLVQSYQNDKETTFSFYTFGGLKEENGMPQPNVEQIHADVSPQEALKILQAEQSILSSESLLPRTNHNWTYVATSLKYILNEYHFSTDPCRDNDQQVTLMAITDKGADAGGESTPVLDRGIEFTQDSWRDFLPSLSKTEQEKLSYLCEGKYRLECDFASENRSNISWLNTDAANLDKLVYRHWDLTESTNIQDTEIWYQVSFPDTHLAFGEMVNPNIPSQPLQSTFNGKAFNGSILLTPMAFKPTASWLANWKK